MRSRWEAVEFIGKELLMKRISNNEKIRLTKESIENKDKNCTSR